MLIQKELKKNNNKKAVRSWVRLSLKSETSREKHGSFLKLGLISFLFGDP